MNPADFSISASPSLAKAATASAAGQKNGLSNVNTSLALNGRAAVQRVDMESLYGQLKEALGDSWIAYKASLNEFLRGSLSQSELSWFLQQLLSPIPAVITSADATKSPVSLLHLHNYFFAAALSNASRDPPPAGLAPWVVATDKPALAAKNASAGSGASDQAEERLKREVMTLHARDRKRIKSLKETPQPVNGGLRDVLEYTQELAIKPPPTTQSQADGSGSQSATATGSATTGLGKTNWDIEIRRRYAQPLACESLEFPTLAEMQNRIEPICFEEGLTGGVQQGSLQSLSELIEQSAEVYIKEMLSSLFSHARSNAVDGLGVQTNKYKRKLRLEEDGFERGTIQRNAAGLLPMQMDSQAKEDPYSLHELRLSTELADGFLASDRFLEELIMLNHYPSIEIEQPKTNGITQPHVNGVNKDDDADAMDVDDYPSFGHFMGVTGPDHDNVMAALDDCLLAAG